MAKVTITIEDASDGTDVEMVSDPVIELPIQTQEQLDSLSTAQQLSVAVMAVFYRMQEKAK